MGLATAYLVLTGLAIYLASNDKFFPITSFEQQIMQAIDVDTLHYFEKGAGFFSILLSSIPLSFSNIIDLLLKARNRKEFIIACKINCQTS